MCFVYFLAHPTTATTTTATSTCAHIPRNSRSFRFLEYVQLDWLRFRIAFSNATRPFCCCWWWFFVFFVLLLLYSFFVLLIKHKKKYHQIKLCFRTSYFRAPDKCIACPFQLHDKCATRWRGRQWRVRSRERVRERRRRRRHPSRANWFLYLFSYLFSFWERVEPSSVVFAFCLSLPLLFSLSLFLCVLFLLFRHSKQFLG